MSSSKRHGAAFKKSQSAKRLKHVKGRNWSVEPGTWGLRWVWQHLVLLRVDNGGTPHKWGDEGCDDRSIHPCDGDVSGESRLLDSLAFHGEPEVIHVHLVGDWELGPRELWTESVSVLPCGHHTNTHLSCLISLCFTCGTELCGSVNLSSSLNVILICRL